MWCFLSVFWLSTLHSVNLWSCLPSLVFAWGQARSKLGGVDTSILHHYFVSYFTVIHWYISHLEMILMLFPLFLHVWWSLEDLLPESGFCWKKDRQNTIFQKIRKFQKNTRKLYFTRRLKKPEGEGERSNRAGSPPGGVGPPLAAPTCGEATLARFCYCLFAYFIVPKNLSQGGAQR
jgi:hypothetical protein